MSKNFNCPVCYWPYLEEDPDKCTYEICNRCGVEFGYEPPEHYPAIRQSWIKAGKPFWKDTFEKREFWKRIWKGI